MSEQFKPLAEQVSEKMANLLSDNRSIFTKSMKDDGTSQFMMPVNARTKMPYKGPSALILLMQNRRDPRWLTYDQARFNKTPVKRGAHGVMIEFGSTNELRQKTENGQPVMKENGQPKMERVKLDEPVTVQAFMYNGKDLMNLKTGEVKPNPLTPVERAQVILENSGVGIERPVEMTHYDRSSDTIRMPAMDEFEKPELYYAVALHELAHATAHETRLNRPDLDHADFDDLAKEELRTNIASILISAELNLPFNLGEHDSFLIPWAQILKENPNELFNAASDAQKIADFVVGLERQVGQKQEASQSQVNGKLKEGMEIAYNSTTYKILEKQNKGAFKIEDMTTNQKIRITQTSGLYKSLLKQLNDPGQGQVTEKQQKPEKEQEQDRRQEQDEELELAAAETETKSHSRKR
jgi:antirestriction protein ArdC